MITEDEIEDGRKVPKGLVTHTHKHIHIYQLRIFLYYTFSFKMYMPTKK